MSIATSEAVGDLRARFSGAVLAPGDAGFAEAVAAWNTVVVHRPVAVVLPESVEDVVTAVSYARRRGLKVAVQATGRGVCRPADGALLVVTSRLRGVEVDAAAAVAHVAAGAQWGEVLAATAEHGLVPVLGSSPGVGVLGYALGGGLGWFARRWGTGADSIVSLDVVTPDGTVVRATQDDEPELFWALRGAGAGAFGVVVGVDLALQPLTQVYAGNLWYPAERAAEVVRRWREWSADAPVELTTAVALMTYPDAERVPEPLRGKAFAVVRGAWSGEPDAGAALVDDWRGWAGPVLDEWRTRPVTEIGEVSQDPMDPLPTVGTTELLDELTDDAVDTVVDGWGYGPNGELRVMFAEIRRLGGAVRDRGDGAVDDRLRSAEHALWFVTVTRNDAHRRRVAAHLAEVRDRLAPHVTGGAFLNFATVGEKADRTRDAFGPQVWQRLRALKSRLDPDHRFCFGLDVPPLEPEQPGRRVPAQSRSVEPDPAPDQASTPGAEPTPTVVEPRRPVPSSPPVSSAAFEPPVVPVPVAGDLPDGYATPGFVVPTVERPDDD